MRPWPASLALAALLALACAPMVSAAGADAASGGRGAAASRSGAAASTLALVIVGDAAIAAPARDVIGAYAQEHGFHVIEAREPGGEGDRRPDPRPFARKAAAVFYIEAMPVGATEVEYYGNVSTLYSVQMALSAYRSGDGSLLWRMPAQSVDFTALNAREKAEETVEPLLAEIGQELRRLR
ncbi:hypothetical protein [Tahibacter harae]|uniref:Uncharacterized protein n=1 Tax=Tahibacter harae TaxID=2963937 RepID=A0ABT1QYE8_9GAMM|nr:hypothetical protein [Tahibacter harae]MCQ4167291.1 hypothetical protein [Tahibacter harae]